MTNDQGIFLDLEGGDLHPDNLRARDLATVISALEAAVVAMVQAEAPEIRADQIRLSLVEIKASSIHRAFTPSLAQLTLPAASRVMRHPSHL